MDILGYSESNYFDEENEIKFKDALRSIINHNLFQFKKVREYFDLQEIKPGEVNTCTQDYETIENIYKELEEYQNQLVPIDEDLSLIEVYKSNQEQWQPAIHAAYNTEENIETIAFLHDIEGNDRDAFIKFAPNIRLQKQWHQALINTLLSAAIASPADVNFIWDELTTAYTNQGLTIPKVDVIKALEIVNQPWALKQFKAACPALAPIAQHQNTAINNSSILYFNQASILLNNILGVLAFLAGMGTLGVSSFAQGKKQHCVQDRRKWLAERTLKVAEEINQTLVNLNAANVTLSKQLDKIKGLEATWEQRVPQHIRTMLEGDKEAAIKNGRLSTWDFMLNFWLDWFARVGLECINPNTANAPESEATTLNFDTPACWKNTQAHFNTLKTLPNEQLQLGKRLQEAQSILTPSTIASLFCPGGRHFTQIKETDVFYSGYDQASFIEITRGAITDSPFSQYGKGNNTCMATGMPPDIMFSRARELFLYLARNASLPNITMAATTMSIAPADPVRDSSTSWPPYVLGDGLNQSAWKQYSSLSGNVTILAKTMATAEQKLSELQTNTNNLQYGLKNKQRSQNYLPQSAKNHFRDCFRDSTFEAGLLLDPSQLKPLFGSWVGLTTIGCTLLTLGMCATKFNAWQQRMVRLYLTRPETNNAEPNNAAA